MYLLLAVSVQNGDNFRRLKALIPFNRYTEFASTYYNNKLVNINGKINTAKYITDIVVSQNLNDISISELTLKSSLTWNITNISSATPTDTTWIQFKGQSYAIYNESYIYGVPLWYNPSHGETFGDFLFTFDLSSDTYIDKQLIINGQNHYSSCVVATDEYYGYIIIIGGRSGYHGRIIRNIDIYDIIAENWITEPSNLTVGVALPGCAFYEGYVYIFGGQIETTQIATNLIQKFDITSKTTHVVSSNLSFARYDFQCMTFDVNIYCVGGINNSAVIFDTVDVFDVKKEEVIYDSNLRLTNGRYSHKMVRYKEKYILVYGGIMDQAEFDNTIEISPKLIDGNNDNNNGKTLVLIIVGSGGILIICLMMLICIWYYRKRRGRYQRLTTTQFEVMVQK